MTLLRRLLRRSLQHLGYCAHRWPGNRFDAMEDAFVSLQKRGYEPRVVIDCGANMGSWTRMARSVFPNAHYHLIEPQAGCAAELQRLVKRGSRMAYHPVALSTPGVASVRMTGTRGETGTYVLHAQENSPEGVDVPATTLDGLLADRVAAGDRTLLKLNCEGHEVPILCGWLSLLDSIEVIVSEAQFYDINSSRRPVFRDLLPFLGERGFEVYDFASLSPRQRDNRLQLGDVILVRCSSPLLADTEWE